MSGGGKICTRFAPKLLVKGVFRVTYENRFLAGKKPGFVGQIFVGIYGFSCRRKTGVHALLLTRGARNRSLSTGRPKTD